jgi:hypothetical protein
VERNGRVWRISACTALDLVRRALFFFGRVAGIVPLA